MYEHVKTGCKHISPSEQPLQFHSGYFLNKPLIKGKKGKGKNKVRKEEEPSKNCGWSATQVLSHFSKIIKNIQVLSPNLNHSELVYEVTCRMCILSTSNVCILEPFFALLGELRYVCHVVKNVLPIYAS